MRVVHGTVVSGKVVLEADSFAEGEKVAVFGHDGSEPFVLSDEDEAALQEAIDQIERGEGITAEELLRDLRNDK